MHQKEFYVRGSTLRFLLKKRKLTVMEVESQGTHLLIVSVWFIWSHWYRKEIKIYLCKWFRKKKWQQNQTQLIHYSPESSSVTVLPRPSLAQKKMLDFNHKDFLSRLKANFHCPFNLSLKLCIVFIFLIWADLLYTNTVLKQWSKYYVLTQLFYFQRPALQQPAVKSSVMLIWDGKLW